MGEPSVVPGRELDAGWLVVLGRAIFVVEIAIIFVWSVELDLKKAAGGRIPLEYHLLYTVMSLTSATAITNNGGCCRGTGNGNDYDRG